MSPPAPRNLKKKIRYKKVSPVRDDGIARDLAGPRGILRVRGGVLLVFRFVRPLGLR